MGEQEQNMFQHVIDIDDEKDQDLLLANIESNLPAGISICNCEYMPTYKGWLKREDEEEEELEPINYMKVASFDWSVYDTNKINQKIASEI